MKLKMLKVNQILSFLLEMLKGLKWLVKIQNLFQDPEIMTVKINHSLKNKLLNINLEQEKDLILMEMIISIK